MNVFRLYLWREWREHRTSLVALFLALPILAALITQSLSRRTLADPWVTCALALAFVLIVLVAVGAELLGGERRGSGLRWLERLPGGLGSAFGAKLALLVASAGAAAGCGFATTRLIALARGATAVAWDREVTDALSFAVVLVVWAFACSAWTLRGGVAFLAAALVLALIGYPAWRVVAEGYIISPIELRTAVALLACGGICSAVLAFMLGSKHGRGTGVAALFGLAPALPLLGLSFGWSFDRFQDRDRIDPRADDFYIEDSWVTADARRAITLVYHDSHRWNRLPRHVLVVDLDDGSWEEAGRRFVSSEVVSERTENGPARDTQLVIWLEENERALVFDLDDGTPLHDRKKSRIEWQSVGLGQWIKPEREPEFVHDPFRGCDYPCRGIPFWKSYWETDVLVRPGRWLCREDAGSPWFLYDPDSQVREPLAMDVLQVIGLMRDGRVLLDLWDAEDACLDLEGACTTLTLDERFLLPTGNERLFGTYEREGFVWYVLDPETLAAQVVPAVGIHEEHMGTLTDDQALLLVDRSHLVALDLDTGARTAVFPRPSN